MGRPRKEKPWCLECRSTRPRHQWKRADQRGSCDTHYRRWLRTFPLCRFEGCQVRLGVPKGKPKPDATGKLRPNKPKDSRQGLCRRHDHLLLKEPHRTPEQIAADLAKFVQGIRPDPVLGCWLWDDRVNRKGYGLICIGRRDWLAHRFSFGFFIGGHRPGLTLDHVCRNRRCVRPDHLLPVTLHRNRQMEDREHSPETIARDLAQIPHMPANVALWAMLHRLPIGRAIPGQPFGFGMDGVNIEHAAGPAECPQAKDLVRI